ncbi:MAG: flagellar protein [Lachnospiraceae bacterium]|jgi:flagellar operon protein (TIGR03826 family)|nr:flagellar protein [Lachnospiraceae bacterium]MCI9676456.1 flagellar protein [Lachnospiraceae bacterium]
MNVRNCRTCGRIFNYIAGPHTCPSCREKLEEKFQEVKEYIRAHKGAGINEVADACDVDAGQIHQWLREERLEVTEDSPIQLTCENCGAFIRSGRFCDKCTMSVTQGFQNMLNANAPKPAMKKKPDKENPKMRFLQ